MFLPNPIPEDWPVWLVLLLSAAEFAKCVLVSYVIIHFIIKFW